MIIVSTKQVPRSCQHSYAHLLLSQCLKEHGVDYAAGVTPVRFGKHGKPSLTEHPELHFNISHADGIAAVIVSEHECGIDCEPIRKYNPRMMKRIFSDSEREAVETALDGQCNLMFFSFWTLKEAYVKAIGRGLSFPLREAAFAFEGDRIVTAPKGCSFIRYIIGDEFVVSACEVSEDSEARESFDLRVIDGK